MNPRASDRAMSKVRNGEHGRGGVERHLVALGAHPRNEGEPGREWLEEALQAVGARVVAHGDNHKYAAYTGPRTTAVGCDVLRVPARLTATHQERHIDYAKQAAKAWAAEGTLSRGCRPRAATPTERPADHLHQLDSPAGA